MQRVDIGAGLAAVSPEEQGICPGIEHPAVDAPECEQHEKKSVRVHVRDEEQQRRGDDLGHAQDQPARSPIEHPAADQRAQRPSRGAQEEDHAHLAERAARLRGERRKRGSENGHVETGGEEEREIAGRSPDSAGHAGLLRSENVRPRWWRHDTPAPGSGAPHPGRADGGQRARYISHPVLPGLTTQISRPGLRFGTAVQWTLIR